MIMKTWTIAIGAKSKISLAERDEFSAYLHIDNGDDSLAIIISKEQFRELASLTYQFELMPPLPVVEAQQELAEALDAKAEG